MGRMLQWESQNELNAFRLLDCNPEISRFCEQPCEIVHTIRGDEHKHRPDILVQRNGLKEFWEVKPDTETMDADLVERNALLAQDLHSLGYRYRVMNAKELAVQPRLRNAITLLRLGYREITALQRESVRLAFKKYGHLVWSHASEGHYGHRGLQMLCRLVLEGTLLVDVNSPLGPDTRFIVGYGGF